MSLGLPASAGVTITIDMTIKPEFAEAVTAGIPAMFVDTGKFIGFRDIAVSRHADMFNRLVVIEHWDTLEHYEAYLDWRSASGQMETALAALISIRTDVWPILIGAAQA